MVRTFSLSATGLIVALIFAAGCSTTSGPSASMATGALKTPADQTTYKYKDQPITLTTANGVSTGSGPVTYVFEVAPDSAFSTKAYTSAKVPPGANGQTSNTLDKTLEGGSGGVAKTYYWRVQVFDGDEAGPYSPVQKFGVMPPATISIPVLASPSNGATTGAIPHFVVNNSTATGTVGAIAYNYQISRNTAFTDKVESGFATQQSGSQTGWDGKNVLDAGVTYYWRVWASDSAGNQSDFSATNSFKVQIFDPTAAIFWDNPHIGRWSETAAITRIDFSQGYVVVDFDRRQGGGKWPSVPFGDGKGGTIQYCLGMCFFIEGKWHCSAAIQFWDGRELEAGGRADEIGINWYYDGRWGSMAGHQPAQGELVAIFAANGNVRDSMSWGIEQRTNFVLIPYGTNYNK
jgi:hypothetical protein